MLKNLLCLLCLCLIIPFGKGYTQPTTEQLTQFLKWRCVGPANFAGRFVDVEAVENDYTHVIAASASGGVWKSVNAGTTWKPIFDNYSSASIGDIKVYQKNPNIIWVGTGEANNRNSVAWGDGIYKSTDGGKTFEHKGLGETKQISRILIHPDDPDIVYVAAIGYLWGFSGERGVFKSEDGGNTWRKLTGGLPDDGKTGAIDLVMDPKKPNTLYVAMYQRLRKPYRFDSGGENGGIYKTTNSGKTWKKLTNGLPEGPTGRIGLDIYRKNPKILMAIVEHGNQPKPYEPEFNDMNNLGTGIYRSEDGGKSWKFLNRYNNRPFYYSQIRINPTDDQRVYVLSTTIQTSDDGGQTFTRGGLNFEGGLDFHGLWIDPNDGDRYYLAKDKGLTLTYDHGEHFILFDNMPVGQFYALGVDNRDPYYIYGGTQDNGTWGGPNFSKDARGVLNDSWWKLHWGDGMYIQIDPDDWTNGFTESENGSFRHYNVKTREVEYRRPASSNLIDPAGHLAGANAENWRDLVRHNWRSPLVMSKHNAQTLYLGANHLFKTVDSGHSWQVISPDLSTNDPVKTDRESGGLTRDITGAETHCAITAFSESKLDPAMLWVGTDDGNVQITRNGGASWENMRSRIPDVPDALWVSCIEASVHQAGTAYVTFDGHRSDNLEPWIFKTADYGENWQRITDGINQGQVMYVIREDQKNPNLLYAGSEFACFMSVDGGTSWAKLMPDMPTVAFHDLVIHPREGDLVAGTHGRGFWVLDDPTPLQQLDDKVLNTDAHLFDSKIMTVWNDRSRGGVRGHFYYAADNPPYIPYREDVVRKKLISGGLMHYYLKHEIGSGVRLIITSLDGAQWRIIDGPGTAGIHRVLWDFNFDPTEEQITNFHTRMQEMFERFFALENLSQEHRQWIEEQQQRLAAAKTLEEMNAPLTAMREKYVNERSMRRMFISPLSPNIAGPGIYRVVLQIPGKSIEKFIEIRKDPME